MRIKNDLGAESIREKLTDISPFLIITCFVLSLLSFGVLKYSYQVNLFHEDQSTISVPIAILIALVSQLGRLAFGLVGVRDLVRGNKLKGALGIIASIAITVYEHLEVTRMVESWDSPEMYYPIVFLVWIALVFELRLMMTMSENKDAHKLEEERIAAAEQKEAARWEAERKRLEKQIKTEYEIREKENKLQHQLQQMQYKEQQTAKALAERNTRLRKEQEALETRLQQEAANRKARLLKEEADRQARLEQETTERKARLAKEEQDRQAKRAKKAAKRKAKLAKKETKQATKTEKPVPVAKVEVPTELGNGQLTPSTNGKHS